MELPTTMVSPAPNWADGYRAYARTTNIDQSLHVLEVALNHVGACLNPTLDGSRATGHWRPEVDWTN